MVCVLLLIVKLLSYLMLPILLISSTIRPLISDHAMICQHGGLTFICHNELRDITAEWLDKVCYDITIKPPLQQLAGETLFLQLQIGRMKLVLIFMLVNFRDEI